ncbi:hypothetical protein, partial [Catenulispora subtropica]|uniref:hypothetical protein n=1 Tax=Catenulispora subtropica TaxID=450798 RepID=UPI0031DB5661
GAGRPRPPSLREREAAVRAFGAGLRRSRRRIAAVAASLVLAAAVAAAATAWFDGVAGAADRAAVVSLSVDSVVDGDPAVAKYDAAHMSATAEYVVELANNSPDAVTLASVGFDAGTLMASTGWKPVGGSPRIPGGATAEVTLSVRLFCPMMVVGVQTGSFGVAARGGNGASSMPFPALDVVVRDGAGDERSLTLPTHVTVPSLLRGDSGDLTFVGSGLEPIPQVVTADAGACAQWEADRERQLLQRELATPPDTDPERTTGGLAFTYDKPLSQSGSTFTLGVNVRNTTTHALTLTTRSDAGSLQNPAVRTEWQPTDLTIAAGQTQQVRLTVTVRECRELQNGDVGRGGVPGLAEALLEVDDPGAGVTFPVYPDQLMTGSLRMARDTAQEIKAACA